MPYTIQTSRRSEIFIDTTVARIKRLISPASAARWHDGILRKIRSLKNRPEMWPLADEAAELGIELRQVLFGRRPHVYRILFSIEGHSVYIHRVRHAAQDRLTSDDI